jgi:lipopolysaccharide transport system permease protein
MILPASAVVVAFVDFAITMVILAGVMAWYHLWPTWRICLLPVFTMLAFLSAMGPGLLFTALNVKYRDFRYIIPFVVQFGMFVSPVFWRTAQAQEKFGEWGRLVISINPIVSVIDGFRWAICGDTEIHWPSFAMSSAFGLVLLGVGIWYFRKTEKTFADVI